MMSSSNMKGTPPFSSSATGSKALSVICSNSQKSSSSKASSKTTRSSGGGVKKASKATFGAKFSKTEMCSTQRPMTAGRRRLQREIKAVISIYNVFDGKLQYQDSRNQFGSDKIATKDDRQQLKALKDSREKSRAVCIEKLTETLSNLCSNGAFTFAEVSSMVSLHLKGKTQSHKRKHTDYYANLAKRKASADPPEKQASAASDENDDTALLSADEDDGPTATANSSAPSVTQVFKLYDRVFVNVNGDTVKGTISQVAQGDQLSCIVRYQDPKTKEYEEDAFLTKEIEPRS